MLEFVLEGIAREVLKVDYRSMVDLATARWDLAGRRNMG